MTPWLDRDFLFVVGKGGVGKSTVSGALAFALAAQGKRVLLAMCNTKESLSTTLGIAPINTEHRMISPGIEAVNMTPQRALEEYGLMVLKVRALHQAIFGNRLVTAFLHGTPGIDAWAMLGKAYFHANEKDASGRKKYDTVILDAPATGHALDMLRVPRVLTEVAPPGLLRREAENAIELFQDRRRTGAVLVTLPEDMPTNETIELHGNMTKELRIDVPAVIINRMDASLFPDAASRAALDAAADHPHILAARRRARREAMQRECVARLREALPTEFDVLPNLRTRTLDRGDLQLLAQHLAGTVKPA